MKAIEELCAAVERRLQRTWHHTLVGEDAHWPCRFPLGRPSGEALRSDFGSVQDWVWQWQQWADTHGLTLEYVTRRTGGTVESVPAHVTIPGVDTAATVAGEGWPARLRRGRTRLNVLRTEFPQHSDLGRVVRTVDGYSETDFEVLCKAARWFQTRRGGGLSPRQVPIEGLHSKWLNNHQATVADLAGVEDLGLVEVRATPIHFTYLDPAHRAGGGRRHDSVCPGDAAMVPAYWPEVVLITENKDTAILFPELERAVAVQGGGKAGPSLLAQVGWLRDAPRMLYWGDLDADGFEIVHDYRSQGVPVETVLMDLATLHGYARFRAETDPRGKPLKPNKRRELPLLTETERDVYWALTEPGGAGPVRVEQERIPLTVAREAVARWLRG